MKTNCHNLRIKNHISMEKEKVTLEDAKEHGLTEEEFNEIINILGRTPNSTELGIFSGMWSEHCSYKNSILKLKTLPSQSELMLTGAGEENAGALDIGDGLAVVFKIESHNHPTAVEPYQGAATGVGGIMRDIFTMGARPFISLNSLRFGNPKIPRNKYLLTRAVKGIGDYGNSLGIAVAGGELFIDDSFSKNPLVNAMTVGFAKHDDMASATTGGMVGYPVYIVGSTTGRDGIHGASFASQDLTKETEEKRSAVQVGDPFMEKLLMEASLEAIRKKLIVGIQDMGAAGISCSTSEMSARGKTGLEIDLDLVPYRETDMNAYETMLSESQERMLVVPKVECEQEFIDVFMKWNLNVTKVGIVTADNLVRVKKDGNIKAEIPAQSLVLGGGAPRYEREEKRPKYLDEIVRFSKDSIWDLNVKKEKPNFLENILFRMIASINICSRKPLYEQYDTEVGLVKVIPPGGDGGLSRIPETFKGIAVSTDCNSRYTYTNPYLGTVWSVCEAARNVIATGARPLGITNNLNFANPYKPENYYVFSECIRGMGDACRFLQLPVTGGNVSFYNESPDGPVYPTPTIGMVGYIEDVRNHIKNYLIDANSKIAMVGNFRPSLGASEYLKVIHDKVAGQIPDIKLQDESNLQKLILELNDTKFILTAKDLSLGGLLIGICKIAFPSKIGIRLNLSEFFDLRNDELFFGETAASMLVSYKKENEDKIKEITKEHNLSFYYLGETQSSYKLNITNYGLEFNLESLERQYENGLLSVFHS